MQPGQCAEHDADGAHRVDAVLQPAALGQQGNRSHRDPDLQRRRGLGPAMVLMDLLMEKVLFLLF